MTNAASAPVTSFPIDTVVHEGGAGPEDRTEAQRGPGRPKKVPGAAAAAPPADDAKPKDPLELLRLWRAPLEDKSSSLEATWHWILAHIGEPFPHWEAHQIGITVIRLTNGMASQPEYLDPKIRGDQVLGDPAAAHAPGDALKSWVIEFYHQRPGTPNSYRILFTGPDNEHISMTDPFRLDAFKAIKDRREAIEQQTNLDTSAGGPLGQAWRNPPPGFKPLLPQAAPPAGAPAAAAPAAAPAGGDWALHQELGYLRAVCNEAERARLENRVPVAIPRPPLEPPPVAAAAPPAPAAEDEEARTLRLLAKLGIKPKTEEERLQEMLASLSRGLTENIMKGMVALYGPPPPPGAAPVGAGGAPSQSTGQPAPAAEPPPKPPTTADLLRDILRREEEVENDKAMVRKIFKIPDAPPPDAEEHRAEIVGPEDREQEKESWWMTQIKGVAEQAIRNPEAIMAVAGNLLDGSPAGQMLSKIGESIAAGKQAARTVGGSGPMGGGGGPRGPFQPPTA